jgi:hypothetical protein
MAMRYIIRRKNAADFADIKPQIPDLDGKLGTAAEGLKNAIVVPLTPVRTAQYSFMTRKTEAGWVWVCTTLELTAENEKGLFALTKQFGAEKPSHLSHLPE